MNSTGQTICPACAQPMPRGLVLCPACFARVPALTLDRWAWGGCLRAGRAWEAVLSSLTPAAQPSQQHLAL